MLIGVLKEQRIPIVPMVPETMLRLQKNGHRFMVESGAGLESNFTDEQYAEVATVHTRREILQQAEIIITVQVPSKEDLEWIHPDAWLITNTERYASDEALKPFEGKSFRVLSMDEIPRNSIAQSMDVLSSMASLAGYRAVLLASTLFTRYFPMMITAAGSIKPAKVLIIGAGVAGLQAIATARRLGAQVEAFDVRSAVKEEVLSLGARFVEIEGAREDSSAGGYAVEQSEDYLRRQKEEVQKRAIQSDIVITTAQIRGKKAPILITNDTVQSMKPGSVIIDLAASTGGNCESTVNGETQIFNGVRVVGNSNLAYEMKQDASLLYGNNIANFLNHYVRLHASGTDDICKAVWVNKPI